MTGATLNAHGQPERLDHHRAVPVLHQPHCSRPPSRPPSAPGSTTRRRGGGRGRRRLRRRHRQQRRQGILPNGTIKTIGSGFSSPTGVAVDAAGDVFVADTGNNAVKEILPNGTIKTIGSGFSNPAGVAVDAAGDVFVADTDNNAVKEILPNGTIMTLGSGFLHPQGVAVDAAGDVFVADTATTPSRNPAQRHHHDPRLRVQRPDRRGGGRGRRRLRRRLRQQRRQGGPAQRHHHDHRLGVQQPARRGGGRGRRRLRRRRGNNRVVELSPPTVAATPSPLSGTTAKAVSATLTGLTPGTTYYYRVVATGAGGTVADTSTGSFMTPQGTPTCHAVAPGTATVSYGQSATFTATVSSSAGVPPDGSVQFLVNGVAYGSPVALSGATAQLAISEPAGSYTIAAGSTPATPTMPRRCPRPRRRAASPSIRPRPIPLSHRVRPRSASVSRPRSPPQCRRRPVCRRTARCSSWSTACHGSPVALSGAGGACDFRAGGQLHDHREVHGGDSNFSGSTSTASTLTVNPGGSLITLASFDGTNGAIAAGGLVMDAAGNSFGTTGQGGTSNAGTVFELAAGSGTITTLASFNGTNGQDPNVGLIEDSSGNLFGTTAGGGNASNDGTVFEVAAGSGTITTLAPFNGTNGANPERQLWSRTAAAISSAPPSWRRSVG